MKPSTKQQLIEQLNRAFEEKIQSKQKTKYAKYVRELTEKLVDKRPKNRIEMQKIIRAQKLDTKTATRMFTVLGSVSASIMNPPNTLQERQKLEPLKQIMRAYSVTSPRTFADNVYNMTTGRNMSKRNEQFRPALLSYYSGFTETIETADQQYQRALQRSQLESKSAIFEDFEDMRRERIPVTKQKTLLLEKYANPIRVQRLLETELHEQAERTKLEQSKFMQYTHKEWNTQRDERVRNTKFHQIVDKQRVPINSNFRGGGEEADYPGDIGLPPGERINCRCYVTYFNSPNERVKRTPVTVPTTSAPAAEALSAIQQTQATNKQTQTNRRSANANRTSQSTNQQPQNQSTQETQNIGKPQRIAEITEDVVVDSQRHVLSPKQIDYFKDSKIRNEQGELIRLYHGSTSENITEFSNEFAGRGSGVPENIFYFTNDQETAKNFSSEREETDSMFFERQTGRFGKVYEVYLDVKNPLDLRNIGEKEETLLGELVAKQFGMEGEIGIQWVRNAKQNHQLIKTVLNEEVLKENGYDGLIAEMYMGTGVLEYGVVDSSQIKLTENLNPTKSKKIIE